jgi:hypothetical protein
MWRGFQASVRIRLLASAVRQIDAPRFTQHIYELLPCYELLITPADMRKTLFAIHDIYR